MSRKVRNSEVWLDCDNGSVCLVSCRSVVGVGEELVIITRWSAARILALARHRDRVSPSSPALLVLYFV